MRISRFFDLLSRFALGGVLTAFTLMPVQAQAQPPVRFATVYKVTGSVAATDPGSGRVRELKAGDAVYVGEQVRSNGAGEAVLRTDDAGVIAIRPNASFTMERFAANGDSRDQFGLRIFSGALRIITGWTGLVSKSNHRIVTPTGTVGIRGTDHEPYVLSAQMAVDLGQPAGTYNKVNQGGTVLSVEGAELDIEAGKVGFAPAAKPGKSRALLTVLMPTLLDKVPGFFVPGTFDTELESLASSSLKDARAKGRFTAAAGAAAAPVAGATPPPAVGAKQAAAAADPAGCPVTTIAANWLAELDAAIQARNADGFIAKFDPAATITATVRGANGNPTQVSFSRDEMAKSTFTAMAQLSQFETRRPSIRATLGKDSTAQRCDRLVVESIVIESGVRNGGSYRLESLETYHLVKQERGWIAVQAQTAQQ